MAYASDNEINLILSVIDHKYRRLFINFIDEVGELTINEAVNLTWDQVDNTYLTIKGRQVYLSNRAKLCLPAKRTDIPFVWRNEEVEFPMTMTDTNTNTNTFEPVINHITFHEPISVEAVNELRAKRAQLERDKEEIRKTQSLMAKKMRFIVACLWIQEVNRRIMSGDPVNGIYDTNSGRTHTRQYLEVLSVRMPVWNNSPDPYVDITDLGSVTVKVTRETKQTDYKTVREVKPKHTVETYSLREVDVDDFNIVLPKPLTNLWDM